jgi:hypothetical protein
MLSVYKALISFALYKQTLRDAFGDGLKRGSTSPIQPFMPLGPGSGGQDFDPDGPYRRIGASSFTGILLVARVDLLQE